MDLYHKVLFRVATIHRYCYSKTGHAFHIGATLYEILPNVQAPPRVVEDILKRLIEDGKVEYKESQKRYRIKADRRPEILAQFGYL